ncbi:FG-GAP repeat domain-containing protein [Streptomyces sp. NPDC058734]|uniref:FG-GAP repeat domain-containing protein n=1 Tax=Streptomyces sp. NPDC058734 TaxID=3346615 RepID=UPI0036CAA4F1
MSGDGKRDLVVAHTDRTITVFLGDGSGAFGAPVTHPVGGRAPAGVAITDVNTDGKPDLATKNGPDNQPTVLLGDGTGTPQRQPAVRHGERRVRRRRPERRRPTRLGGRIHRRGGRGAGAAEHLEAEGHGPVDDGAGHQGARRPVSRRARPRSASL